MAINQHYIKTTFQKQELQEDLAFKLMEATNKVQRIEIRLRRFKDKKNALKAKIYHTMEQLEDLKVMASVYKDNSRAKKIFELKYMSLYVELLKLEFNLEDRFPPMREMKMQADLDAWKAKKQQWEAQLEAIESIAQERDTIHEHTQHVTKPHAVNLENEVGFIEMIQSMQEEIHAVKSKPDYQPHDLEQIPIIGERLKMSDLIVKRKQHYMELVKYLHLPWVHQKKAWNTLFRF